MTPTADYLERGPPQGVRVSSSFWRLTIGHRVTTMPPQMERPVLPMAVCADSVPLCLGYQGHAVTSLCQSKVLAGEDILTGGPTHVY